MQQSVVALRNRMEPMTMNRTGFEERSQLVSAADCVAASKPRA
jgi:hypothetical protein